MLSFALLLACSAGPDGLGAPTASTPAPLQTSSPGRPATLLPLQVGARWTYELYKREGRELRLLLFPIKRPPELAAGSLSLELLSQGTDGRFKARLTRKDAEGELKRAELTIWSDDKGTWMERDGEVTAAIEATLPERALSLELLPCKAPIFGGMEGLCSAAPGGPLEIPPGPQAGPLVYELIHSPGEVGLGLLLGLTVMTNEVRELAAVREGYTPGAPPAGRYPLWEAWSDGEPTLRRLEAALKRTPADAESLAAIVKTADYKVRHELVLAGLPFLPEADRAPLLRAALPLVTSHAYDQARVLALSAALLPPLSEAELDALLAHADGEQARAQWRALVVNPDPYVLALYRQAERVTRFKPALQDMAEREFPSDATVEALVLAEGGGPHALGALARACPAERQARFLAAHHDDMYGDDILSVLRDNPKLAAALPEATRREIVEGVQYEPDVDEISALLGL